MLPIIIEPPPTGIEVWTAPNPLGPWSDMNLDLNPGNSLGVLGREIRAQCNYVIEIEHEAREKDYLYSGDLWSSSPDGLKSHDIQYWSPPLQFDDAAQPPSIAILHFVNNFTINAS